MKWVSLYFYNPSFPVFGQDAATCRALATGRCIPGGLADDHIIGRFYQREEIFGGRIAAKCKRHAAYAGNFKKSPPIHFKKDLPIQNRLDGIFPKKTSYRVIKNSYIKNLDN
jgi:hypothetical protein